MLTEARVIIDGAMEYVRSQGGDAAIAVVDERDPCLSRAASPTLAA